MLFKKRKIIENYPEIFLYRVKLNRRGLLENHRVVIIGAGFGGLSAAKALNHPEIELLIIDKTNHHLFQPLLYQVATAALSPGDIAVPIREILRKHSNTTVLMGDVTHVNRAAKEVVMGNGSVFKYDSLILAPGARHSYFGNDAWEHEAPGLKTINDALKIREQILISFEKAERLGNTGGVDGYLTFVVIGGGPTGVEMAGAIAEVAKHSLFKNFRNICPETAKIYLVEGLPHLLPSYPERLSTKAKEDLEKMGVTVILGKKVIQISDKGVQVEETFIESKNIIWAAGNQASPLLKTINATIDRAGRVMVDTYLNVPDDPSVFVVGDAAHAIGPDGKPLPGVATTALQQGKYVGGVILDRLNKKIAAPFKYWDKGSMATIGKSKAVATVGKLQLHGFLAWSAWCFIHIAYLIGFRNRLSVMIQWSSMFFTGKRDVRLIYTRSLEQELPHK